MERDYHDNNKREFELTKHVSLRQLNPLALLTLKATGACEVTVPEWLFNLDGPGHYMRRIKTVSLSIPSVAGPYTSVSCTLSLLKSSLRKSPLLADGEYGRAGSEDTRFADSFGAIQSIVTSSGNNDSGLFETNLRDERFLPFEGAGAESTWKLELPASFRQFAYNTISDVILHIRYTARQGGALLAQGAVQHFESLIEDANTSGLALLFSLRNDFPNEWHKFAAENATLPFSWKLRRDHFPYFTQGKDVAVTGIKVFAITDGELQQITPQLGTIDWGPFNDVAAGEITFSLPLGPDVLNPKNAAVFVLAKYTLQP